MSETIADLEEQGRRKSAELGARETKRYFDLLRLEGFDAEQAIRIVVAWQGRPAGMDSQTLERVMQDFARSLLSLSD